jgi:hypothetical protein
MADTDKNTDTASGPASGTASGSASDTPESPDLADLAKRYLDLWQDHWSSLLLDPRTAESMTRFYSMVGEHMAAIMTRIADRDAGVPFAQGGGAAAEGEHEPSDDRTDDGTAGAAAAAAASAGGAQRLDEFARRLAAIEERLARLEAQRGDDGPDGGTRQTSDREAG